MKHLLDLDGPRFGPAQGGSAEQLVILLHGLGADGNDLIGLAPHFAQRLPQAVFVSPHAPFPCDMAPFGRQWFSLQDRRPDAILAGVKMAAPILASFIDQELDRYGLAPNRLALVGFSQGTMMSLYVGLRREQALAAILGYSGALIGAEDLAAEIKSRPPILLTHGDADEIVPSAALETATSALRANGLAVDSELRPGLGHSIDEVGLMKGMQFLASKLSA